MPKEQAHANAVTRSRTVYVASVSGGKDSTAMMLHLREIGIPYRAVFFDTGWEHADTYAHLDYLEDAMGHAIERSSVVPALSPELTATAEAIESVLGVTPSAFVRLCIKKGMFPSRQRRYCTQLLKMAPAAIAIRQEHERGNLPVNTIGVRAAESAARANLPEREISPSLDCEVWRPILRWSEADVIAIHSRHNIKPNPLYLRGAERVGCYPCIMSRKSELRIIGRDSRRIEAIRLLEKAVGNLAEARNGNNARPALFQRSRTDADGVFSCLPIDDVIEWANTARGVPVEQGTMFDEPEDPNGGCMRWGLCDSHPDDIA